MHFRIVADFETLSFWFSKDLFYIYLLSFQHLNRYYFYTLLPNRYLFIHSPSLYYLKNSSEHFESRNEHGYHQFLFPKTEYHNSSFKHKSLNVFKISDVKNVLLYFTGHTKWYKIKLSL